MKSKWRRSLMPIAFRLSTVAARLVLWISGTGVDSISSRYARSVYSLDFYWECYFPARRFKLGIQYISN